MQYTIMRSCDNNEEYKCLNIFIVFVLVLCTFCYYSLFACLLFHSNLCSGNTLTNKGSKRGFAPMS